MEGDGDGEKESLLKANAVNEEDSESGCSDLRYAGVGGGGVGGVEPAPEKR